jgi:hypothetical protein
MKGLAYSVLIVGFAITGCLTACGNDDVTSRSAAGERYANELEDKEITENPSEVLAPEEGRKGEVAGQLENERQDEEMMERAGEERTVGKNWASPNK